MNIRGYRTLFEADLFGGIVTICNPQYLRLFYDPTHKEERNKIAEKTYRFLREQNLPVTIETPGFVAKTYLEDLGMPSITDTSELVLRALLKMRVGGLA